MAKGEIILNKENNMADIKKTLKLYIDTALADRINFLEDELYNRAYKDIEKLETENAHLKKLCIEQQEVIMDYEWLRLKRSAFISQKNHRKWRAR
ncbi:hypothetical protein BN1356_00938 [Streptococcus varani]|uniref:Uncharacterized protein n=1 Tax=Streptococcus varani TaxID=1608583 RepID=A0A0E4H4F2_9STRE|nr:hypothetical protein [Streptococcus varani]CQR24594.1 hypothetical protein BN1356_00938 [Streptococcus varani]